MKDNIFSLATKGHNHLILILACNWLHYVHMNFLLHNMEISSQKLMFDTKKCNINNVSRPNILFRLLVTPLRCLDENFSLCKIVSSFLQAFYRQDFVYTKYNL